MEDSLLLYDNETRFSFSNQNEKLHEWKKTRRIYIQFS